MRKGSGLVPMPRAFRCKQSSQLWQSPPPPRTCRKLLYRLRDVVLLLVVAGIFRGALEPSRRWSASLGIRRRGMAVFVMTVLAVLVFALIAAAFGIPLSRGITHLAHAMRGYVAKAKHGPRWPAISYAVPRRRVGPPQSIEARQIRPGSGPFADGGHCHRSCLLVYTQIENHVLDPVVMSKTVPVSPLFVLVSVLVGRRLAACWAESSAPSCRPWSRSRPQLRFRPSYATSGGKPRLITHRRPATAVPGSVAWRGRVVPLLCLVNRFGMALSSVPMPRARRDQPRGPRAHLCRSWGVGTITSRAPHARFGLDFSRMLVCDGPRSAARRATGRRALRLCPSSVWRRGAELAGVPSPIDVCATPPGGTPRLINALDHVARHLLALDSQR